MVTIAKIKDILLINAILIQPAKG